MEFLFSHLIDPRAQFCAWMIMAGLALPCLVAIWAAISEVYWFWRALAVWAVVMLMIPLGAWVMTWTFAIAAVLIIGTVQLSRAVERRRQLLATGSGRLAEARYRYTLRD